MKFLLSIINKTLLHSIVDYAIKLEHFNESYIEILKFLVTIKEIDINAKIVLINSYFIAF